MGRTRVAKRSSARLAKKEARSAISRRNQRKLERNKRIEGGCMRPAVTYEKVKGKPIKIDRKQTKTENAKRLSNMKRDAARYALLELKREPDYDRIVLSAIDSTKTVKINFKSNKEVNCSCMDWRIRCKRMKISCKHILYVLDRIFKIDMKSVQKNKIKKPKLIKEAIDKIHKARCSGAHKKFKVGDGKEMSEEDVCAICFCDFLYHTEEEFKDKTLACPMCKNLVHEDCMKCWLRNSHNQNCVYCRSDVWKDLLKS